MTWIDCKVRKPTAEDGDPVGRVLARTQTGGVDTVLWAVVQSYHVAWMRIPDFVPVPDPPEGYEILTDYDAEPDPKALCWHSRNQDWYLRPFKQDIYTRSHIYAVPIKPTEPQYRPFANADEFRPFRDRWWRDKECATVYATRYYDDEMHDNRTWKARFLHYEFEDGTPFGLPIN